MQSLLYLPQANVDVERVFSSVSSIKTKSRNRLQTSTVRALIKVKDGVKMSGGCVLLLLELKAECPVASFMLAQMPTRTRQTARDEALFNTDFCCIRTAK